MSDRCDEVRARLPELAAGRTSADETRDLEAHLEGCTSCAAELQLVRALAAPEVQLPAGLEARVRSALEHSRRRGRLLSPARLAMAASVVLALVTASLLDGGGEAGGNGADPIGDMAQEAPLEAAPWPAVDEPLMRGGPALHQLSLEELEMLLQELES